MKMRCEDPNKPIFCSLTTGHTFVIGPDPVDVPRAFHGQAIDGGAIVVGLEGEMVQPSKEPGKAKADDQRSRTDGDREREIAVACSGMADDGRSGDFSKDGKPDLARLCKRVGFAVTSEERDAAWERYVKA